jgi:hypothetical protein
VAELEWELDIRNLWDANELLRAVAEAADLYQKTGASQFLEQLRARLDAAKEAGAL